MQEPAAAGTPAGAQRGAGSAGESAPGTPTPSDERQAAQPSAPVAALLALKAGARVGLASRRHCYMQHHEETSCGWMAPAVLPAVAY